MKYYCQNKGYVILIRIIGFSCLLIAVTTHEISRFDESKQKEALARKKLECIGRFVTDKLNKNATLETSSGVTPCERFWDGALCWPSSEPGTLVTQPCPEYVSGLVKTNKATRLCTENGTWFVHPKHNQTWTNFSACLQGNRGNSKTVPTIILEHLESVRLMYNVGYGLSLVSLVVAVVIMLYFKRLHCPRNTIHLNLFISFILRAAVSFVKENLLVDYVGFPSDVYYDDGVIKFRQDVTHWECRLFFTVYNYVIAANYIWILVEALYLQMLISIAVFTEKSRIKWYIIFGWTFPLTFIIPWVIVRTLVYNENCWNTYYSNKYIIYIIYGPITLSVVIQFVIFVNIVRILFTKLNASPSPQTHSFRYRRLAKSTLILIPLFGVYYIIFSMAHFDFVDENSTVFLVMWWTELFFNSFQGFILSVLFCFLNHEVQAEFKKAWKRHLLRRSSSTRTCKTMYTSKTNRKDIDTHNNRIESRNGSTHNASIIRPTSAIAYTEENELSPLDTFSYVETAEETSDIEDKAKYEKEECVPCLNNNQIDRCSVDAEDMDKCKGR